MVHQPRLDVVYLGLASVENIASYDRLAETEQFADTALQGVHKGATGS